MIDFLISLSLFILGTLLVPVLTFSYLGLRAFNAAYVTCISVLHPDVQFIKYTTIRTLLDTHRNQGIINVLLCVRGGAQPDVVKRHLLELVRRKNKLGETVFPRLKQCLVTKCGIYAWQRDKFDLDQHVVCAPGTYRGRTISEYNIQDYVSHIVSKYLPPGIAPWQIIIIPTSEDQHYILLKLHHVLLCEGLNIADLLPLIPPTRSSVGSPIAHSPLKQVFKTPEKVPYLKERLAEDFSNKWNEFIANYDPLERPEIFKNGPGLYQYLAILTITIASVIKECRKSFPVIRNDPFSRLKYVYTTFRKEAKKRQVSFSKFFKSIFITTDPRNVITMAVRCCWYFSVSFVVKTPILFYHEVMALYTCVMLRYCVYPNTFVGIVYNYVPLFYYAGKEIAYCFTMLFHAPRTILQEIFFESETIQTVTLCGRKVVAWSQPVKTEFVRAVARQTGVSQTEVTLAAISVAISKYLNQANREEMPEKLPITAINFSSNYVFSSGVNVKPSDSVSGLLCVTLPIPESEKSCLLIQHLHKIRQNFSESLEKQPLLSLLSLMEIKYGILTKLLPATFLSVLLKYLTRKYAISFTEISCKHPNVTQKTLWGQEVVSAIFWRPPQANISISLCLNEYADHVRLGVMCDAQLGPHHPALARGFPEYIKDLAASSGVEFK